MALSPAPLPALGETPQPQRAEGTGHVDTLVQGTHGRLGADSPVSLLPQCMLSDLCRSMAESVVVVDALTDQWTSGSGSSAGHLDHEMLPPLCLRTAGRPPELWSWSATERHPALSPGKATVSGSAAAPWQAGRVLVCGGNLVDFSVSHYGCAPSRLLDVARGEWLDCAVPTLEVHGHTAVNHQGDYYVLGGCRRECREADTSMRVHVLAQDGSRWIVADQLGGDCVASACSAAGSLWVSLWTALGDESDGSMRLGRCDPRERSWEFVRAENFVCGYLTGASMVACGHCLYSVGGQLKSDAGRACAAAGGRRCQKLDVRMPRAWQDVAPLNEGRSWCGLVCLEGRQCLVALSGHGVSLASECQSVELYVPAVDKWFPVQQLPRACRCLRKTTVALLPFA
eukprot:m51a1_g593 hypothetical protein (399) ;mRNA; f:52022-53218